MESMLDSLDALDAFDKENRPPKRNRRGRQVGYERQLKKNRAVRSLYAVFESEQPIAAYSEPEPFDRVQQRALLTELLQELYTCWEKSKKPPVTEVDLQGLKDAPPAQLELELVLNVNNSTHNTDDTEAAPIPRDRELDDLSVLSPLPGFELSSFLNDLE